MIDSPRGDFVICFPPPTRYAALCFHGDLAIGYGIALKSRLRNGTVRGRVYSLAVAPAWQRHGVGKLLMDHLEHWLAVSRAGFITLRRMGRTAVPFSSTASVDITSWKRCLDITPQAMACGSGGQSKFPCHQFPDGQLGHLASGFATRYIGVTEEHAMEKIQAAAPISQWGASTCPGRNPSVPSIAGAIVVRSWVRFRQRVAGVNTRRKVLTTTW